MRQIRGGKIVGILIDQSPRENGVPVTFFGRRCWATVAPAMVAVRAKAPIHPVSMTRDSKGRYTVEFLPSIEVRRTGDLRKDLVEAIQNCQDAIESLVRQSPGQWLWMHRRWKERPLLQEEWDARTERGK
jgi:KDO2-lipid IV(A) lauroyltransferase